MSYPTPDYEDPKGLLWLQLFLLLLLVAAAVVVCDVPKWWGSDTFELSEIEAVGGKAQLVTCYERSVCVEQASKACPGEATKAEPGKVYITKGRFHVLTTAKHRNKHSIVFRCVMNDGKKN